MKVQDVMTACPYKIEADTSMDDAVAKMEVYGIRHLPVVKDGNVLGVISKRDLLLSQMVCKSSNFCPTLEELCINPPPIVDAGDSLASVVGEMADKKSDYTLVSRDNQLVGIFTTVDACRTLQRMLEMKAAPH